LTPTSRACGPGFSAWSFHHPSQALESPDVAGKQIVADDAPVLGRPVWRNVESSWPRSSTSKTSDETRLMSGSLSPFAAGAIP
jgi:hypothetical protein